MVITLDSKRRLTLPKSLAPAQPGDAFEAIFDPEEDTVIFRRISRNKDWLAILKKCPMPMDDLPARSRETFKSKL
jgi:bifunctional DNA-binding transcriptional regulator/antitoxin component of YhaV-PrlF toxin-antitoxin module